MSRFLRLGLLLALALGLVLIPATVHAQAGYPLVNCRQGAFSTEEDFMMAEGEPYDGNPYISDGDLLSPSGALCARNRDLLQRFTPTGAAAEDLGLDAVDILNLNDRIVAFSTELDDVFGGFTAGDVLFTNGGVIPNVALLRLFGIGYDIGLDGLQFIGSASNLTSFAGLVVQIGPEGWSGDRLQQELKRYNIDIWFSVEGTHIRTSAPQILDGDVLSAANGTIVASNADLLPPSVPAGLPNRGVDFGADALASALRGDAKSALASMHYSTEILFHGEPAFTDGDVLAKGDGVVLTNQALLSKWHAKADFLGLDALYIGEGEVPTCENQITDVGGLQVDVADINGMGRAEIGYGTDHPFGSMVPFWGTICDDVQRFRVVFRKVSDGLGAGTGIPVLPSEGWLVKDRNPITLACTADVSWSSDADGWYDGPAFRDLLYCNPNLILTNWKSDAAPDPNVLYRTWIEFDRGSGIETEPAAHLVRLDNDVPKINAMEIPGSACTTYGPGSMPIMIQADISDPHFWGYRLSIGGDSYLDHYYAWHNYYDADAPAAHLDSGGTTPASTLVDLHSVTVNDLAASPVACAYGVRLWASDRTIIGYFQPSYNLIGGYFRTPTSREIYFNYVP